ncbi:MAG TPA: hypothetical protein VFJ16_12125 [Longimicrobium sp.]|nr:hypothetical protein [Longimicrobium sp.]
MPACQTVTSWITENVLVPVTEFITEVQEKCEEIGKWVDEQVQQPVTKQISQAQEQCSDWPWPLDWVCDVVMVVVTVVEWVVVTVAKWVVTVVCQLVSVVVGTIVTLVLQVVAWAVSFVVCIFTDPVAALLSFRDLWTIVTDTIGHVFELVDLLLADVDGILGDLENLVDSLASQLGWLGVILGVIKGLIHLVRNIVSAIRDAVRAIGDLVIGLLSGNLCRVIRGALDLVVAGVRIGADTGFGFVPWLIVRAGGAAIGGVRDSVNQHRLEALIRDSLESAFGDDRDRMRRSLATVALRVSPMGVPFQIDARRMFLDSENREVNPKTLHDRGVIDLYRMAGYWSDCGNLNNEPDTEVVYTGTNLHVTYAHLGTYLEDGPGSVPAFRVYAITRAKFRTHLEVARTKMQSLGVRLSYDLGEIEATSFDHLPLNVHDSAGSVPSDKAVQEALFASMGGRDASGANLGTIPAISHFHYIRWAAPGNEPRELFGLTSEFRPADKVMEISGVTYRNLTPDWGLRFVLPHELGHYLGLDHENQNGEDRALEEIMYTPKDGIKIAWSTPFEYLLLEGEPRFTFDDARTVWDWITGPVVRDILLP